MAKPTNDEVILDGTELENEGSGAQVAVSDTPVDVDKIEAVSEGLDFAAMAKDDLQKFAKTLGHTLDLRRKYDDLVDECRSLAIKAATPVAEQRSAGRYKRVASVPPSVKYILNPKTSNKFAPTVALWNRVRQRGDLVAVDSHGNPVVA